MQATDHFRNLDVLLHFLGSCVYGSRGAFAVVSANQRLSIDGGKHIGLIFFLLIWKFRFSLNIYLLKSIETYFVWYRNCWKHNVFKLPYQCFVIITMLIIAMSHLQSWTKGWRQIFLWHVLQLIFCDFLPENVKTWHLIGRLCTRHKIQAFQGFPWNSLIS